MLLAACGTGSGGGTETVAASGDVSIAPPTADPASLPNPTTQNGQPCTTQGGLLLKELHGVSAREGECLINFDGAVGADAHGAATPEQAVREAGFGRFTLTRYQPTDALDAMAYLYETDGPTRVGDYRVNVMQDGSFIVHGVVASTPMK